MYQNCKIQNKYSKSYVSNILIMKNMKKKSQNNSIYNIALNKIKYLWKKNLPRRWKTCRMKTQSIVLWERN